jgi:hypothetical protein
MIESLPRPLEGNTAMSYEFILWIATATYGLHILEEYELN